jgi:two-component system chemotaxis response regulator CheB
MSATLRPRQFEVIGIATSAGGLPAVRTLLSGLPADFPAAVLVVQHRSRSNNDYLRDLLAPSCALPVLMANTGMALLPGQVVLARPGRQLELTAARRIGVERTDRVNYYCPAADVLFASLARHAGPRAIGCVLTGWGSDGAAGVKAIRAAGGFVIAQSPRSAEFPDMPQAAIETGKVDLVLPLRAIAFALARLTMPEEQAA